MKKMNFISIILLIFIFSYCNETVDYYKENGSYITKPLDNVYLGYDDEITKWGDYSDIYLTGYDGDIDPYGVIVDIALDAYIQNPNLDNIEEVTAVDCFNYAADQINDLFFYSELGYFEFYDYPDDDDFLIHIDFENDANYWPNPNWAATGGPSITDPIEGGRFGLMAYLIF